VFTLEVAAQGAQGKAQRARVEVEKGLLFDGVGALNFFTKEKD
jgi:hypothetical protein